MRNLVIKAGLTLACLMVAAPSVGADNEHRSEAFSGSRPVAGFEVESPFGGSWDGVTFYAVVNPTTRQPDGLPWIDYVVRREHRADGQNATVTWTTSDTCPGVRNLVGWLTEISPPRIEVPGITPRDATLEGRRPRMYIADGLSVTLWGRGTQPDNTADTYVEMRGRGGSLSTFARTAVETLEPCWVSDVPTAKGPVI
jgi:hypothetical protein